MQSGDTIIVATEYGAIVLNERTGQYWHLNETAKFILMELSRGLSSAAAATSLTDTFDVQAERALEDVMFTQKFFKEIGAL